jgi:hypothetical protein
LLFGDRYFRSGAGFDPAIAGKVAGFGKAARFDYWLADLL